MFEVCDGRPRSLPGASRYRMVDDSSLAERSNGSGGDLMRDLDPPHDSQSGASLPSFGASNFTRDPNGARSGPSLRRECVAGRRVCNLITISPENGLVRDLWPMGDTDH